MRRPSTSAFEQQLLAQRQQSMAMAQQEAAAFAAERQQSQYQSAAQVATEEAYLKSRTRQAARRPVRLGTLLTNPQGLLGNPVLSGTKLGG